MALSAFTNAAGGVVAGSAGKGQVPNASPELEELLEELDELLEELDELLDELEELLEELDELLEELDELLDELEELLDELEELLEELDELLEELDELLEELEELLEELDELLEELEELLEELDESGSAAPPQLVTSRVNAMIKVMEAKRFFRELHRDFNIGRLPIFIIVVNRLLGLHKRNWSCA